MLSSFLRCLCLVVCVSLASLCATAQEVVHALTGTLNNFDSAAKTMYIITDDGSSGSFKDVTDNHASIEFDKKIRADTTPADAYKNKNTRVIVYYYGEGSDRTAVALRRLGPGPTITSSGSVVNFEKRDHLLKIKDKSGAVESFTVNDNTVVETGMGVEEGLKYDPENGDQVHVTASPANGAKTALFISAM